MLLESASALGVGKSCSDLQIDFLRFNLAYILFNELILGLCSTWVENLH